VEGQLFLVARAEAARLAVEQRTEDRRQKAMARELEWIRSVGQGAPGEGQARINAYEAMLKQNVAEKEKEFEIVIPPGPRLGTLVVEAQGVAKATATTCCSRT
jgi:sulfate-transporting ATPase